MRSRGSCWSSFGQPYKETTACKKSTSDSDIGTDDVSVTVHVSGSVDETDPTGTMVIHGNAVALSVVCNVSVASYPPGCDDALAHFGADYFTVLVIPLKTCGIILDEWV